MAPSEFAVNPPDPPKRPGPRLGGVGFDGAIPFVTSLGVKPLTEAIKYRVFKAYCSELKLSSYDNAVRLRDCRWLLGHMNPVAPMTIEEWMKSVKVSRRRKALEKAWRALCDRDGVHHHEYRIIKPFVKTECLPWFAIFCDFPDVARMSYVARLIQAPHDETHLVAGPYLKPLTHALKKHWNSSNWIFYASAAPEVLDQWLRDICPCESFFWSDYSAFDATWTDSAWDMVEGFYRRIYPEADPEFWEVLKIWRYPEADVRCRKEGARVKYQSEAMMLSGRDDTALANAILNGIVLSISFAAAIAGKDVSQVTEEDLQHAASMVRIAVVGDDSLVGCSFDVTPMRSQIEQGIRHFGLVVKAMSSKNLYDVTFLGCMPYLTSEGFFWGPTIGRRLYKAFWQVDHVNHLPSWTKGVAMQMAMNRCVPFLCELGERVLQLLERHAGQLSVDREKLCTGRESPTAHWDSLTVAWLGLRYPGLTPQMLANDLAVLSKVNRLPAVMHSEVFLRCVADDEL